MIGRKFSKYARDQHGNRCIYMYKDVNGNVIYIGKADCKYNGYQLMSRILEHQKQPQFQEYVQQDGCYVSFFNSIGSPTQLSIMQSALIKQYQPILNISQKETRFRITVQQQDIDWIPAAVYGDISDMNITDIDMDVFEEEKKEKKRCVSSFRKQQITKCKKKKADADAIIKNFLFLFKVRKCLENCVEYVLQSEQCFHWLNKQIQRIFVSNRKKMYPIIFNTSKIKIDYMPESFKKKYRINNLDNLLGFLSYVNYCRRHGYYGHSAWDIIKHFGGIEKTIKIISFLDIVYPWWSCDFMEELYNSFSMNRFKSDKNQEKRRIVYIIKSKVLFDRDGKRVQYDDRISMIGSIEKDIFNKMTIE